MTEISDADMDLLRDAVDTIVADKRRHYPHVDECLWTQFRDTLLEMVVERHAELLLTEAE